jgi:hypothetical protein
MDYAIHSARDHTFSEGWCILDEPDRVDFTDDMILLRGGIVTFPRHGAHAALNLDLRWRVPYCDLGLDLSNFLSLRRNVHS